MARRHHPLPASVPLAVSLAFFLLAGWVPPGTAGLLRDDSALTRERVSGWMERSSGWTPNRGQLVDVEGNPVPDILYATTSGRTRVFVTRTGLMHLFTAPAAADPSQGYTPEESLLGGRQIENESSLYDWSRLDLTLEGANIRPGRAVHGELLEASGTENHYRAHCPEGIVGIPAYGQIQFTGVYPGIDWVVRYGNDGGVHQDFIVAPGADPGRIRLRYDGARSIELSGDGQALVVRTALGEVREGTLFCHQGDESRPVAATFALNGNVVTVSVPEYDRSRPLVIDPPLVWSTYYGGTDYDGPRMILCDNAAATVYVVGYTGSLTDLPVLNPGGGAFYQGTSGGDRDGFIWKFTQAGARLWATYYGGSSGDGVADAAVDGSGRLYIGGWTNSGNLPLMVLGGAYNQGTMTGTQEAFVARFGPTGVLQWATFLGGSGNEEVVGVNVDASGRFHACGNTSSPNFPIVTPGGGAYLQSTLASGTDAFVTRFGTGGSLEWSTFLGGNDEDYATGITTGPAGVYVAGNTLSTDFPTANPGGAWFQGTNAGSTDAFITRFSPAAVLQWSSYYGGSGDDYGDEPALSPSGTLYMYGYTLSPDLPTLDPGGGAFYQPAIAGWSDLMLVRFDAGLARTWATYIGGSLQDAQAGPSGKPIVVDSQGRVTITGVTQSLDYPVLNPGGSYFLGTFAGLQDAVITRFGTNAALLWSTYWGDASYDFGTGLSVNGDDCLYATGESVELGTMPTVNPGWGAWYQAANAGSDDGYIAKFCSPSSACCLDNNCVGVSSAAECAFLGGQTFHGGQPCSTVVCTIDCTICGTKWNDLNGDGIRQGGEPGLSGWTILLSYPNGPVYTSTVTDAQGNYCFTGVPCGNWLVSEVHQPGWVQMVPGGSGHLLSTTTGSTTNGVDFGNFSCPPPGPCPPPPPRLVAWWPFSDAALSAVALDVAHTDPPYNTANRSSAGGGTGSLCLSAPGEYAVVPSAAQIDLDFGAGSFSIAAWVELPPAGAGARVIVDKRHADVAGVSGWALWVDGGQCFVSLGTGTGGPDTFSGMFLPGPGPHHVVVSVDRAGGTGRWYLNGTHESLYDFSPTSGSIDNAADLRMGEPNAPFFGGPLNGCIADLSLFDAPLSAGDVQAAFLAGPAGFCPEYALMPAVTSICQNQDSVQVCFKIANATAVPATYRWSLAPLPAGPGCTAAGPELMFPSAGSVTVPAGGLSAPICVSVKRPPGFTAQNATACFQLTFRNMATGVCRTATSKLRVENACWCVNHTQPNVVGVPARPIAGGTIGLPVGLPCDPVARTFQWRAEWLDATHPDPMAVSLNGLPPGTPVIGTMTAPAGGSELLSVNVSYPGGYDPTGLYEIVLEADTDGGGVLDDRLGGVVVHPLSGGGSSGISLPPSAPKPPAPLRVSPNPFAERTAIAFTLSKPGDVELSIHDLSGRLVRRVTAARFDAGDHRIEWDGRSDAGAQAAAGLYFVRFNGAGVAAEAKIVKAE